MRGKTFLLVLLVLLLMVTGCATYHTPLSTTGSPEGPKTGTVDAITYFGIFGDMSDLTIENAARNGGISKVDTVEVTTKNTLFIIQLTTLTVTGE